METLLEFAIAAIIFGLSAGLTPGPLFTIIVSETLQKGKSAGIKISLAPLISDIPIMIIAILLISSVSNMNPLFGTIALAGGLFLGFLGYKTLFLKPKIEKSKKNNSNSLLKGGMVNFLNPNPYISHFTVTAPLIVSSAKIGVHITVTYLLLFFTALVGSNVLIALLVSKYGNFLNSKAYRYVLIVLGLALIFFALRFIWQAGILFGFV